VSSTSAYFPRINQNSSAAYSLFLCGNDPSLRVKVKQQIRLQRLQFGFFAVSSSTNSSYLEFTAITVLFHIVASNIEACLKVGKVSIFPVENSACYSAIISQMFPLHNRLFSVAAKILL